MRFVFAGAVLTIAAVGFANIIKPAYASSDPIVYNRAGDEVGVIQYITRLAGVRAAIIQPTVATLDLGYYNIAIPMAELRPKRGGGWVTLLSNQDFYDLPPFETGRPRRFWWSSGI